MEFDIKNKRIVVDAHTLMIGPLRAIYEKLPEEVSIPALTYIYVGSQIHPDAPFFSARQDEVQELAWRNSLYGTTDDVKETLEQYRDKFTSVFPEYIEAYSTPEVRMLNTFNHQIDELKDLMQKTKPEIVKSTNPNTAVVTFAHNTDAIQKVMVSLGTLMDTKEKIEAKMRKEAAGRIRAGKKPSRLEKKHAANA